MKRCRNKATHRIHQLTGLLAVTFAVAGSLGLAIAAHADQVTKRDGKVTETNTLDKPNDPLDDTQAISITAANGQWKIKSVEFTPPDRWSFKAFPTTGNYVDLIPANVGGLPVADKNSSSAVQLHWLVNAEPTSADQFGLKAEGNLKPPPGGGGGTGPSKQYHWQAAVKTPTGT